MNRLDWRQPYATLVVRSLPSVDWDFTSKRSPEHLPNSTLLWHVWELLPHKCWSQDLRLLAAVPKAAMAPTVAVAAPTSAVMVIGKIMQQLQPKNISSFLQFVFTVLMSLVFHSLRAMKANFTLKYSFFYLINLIQETMFQCKFVSVTHKLRKTNDT